MPNITLSYSNTPVDRVQTTDDAGNTVQVEIVQVDIAGILKADQDAVTAAQAKLDADTALYAPVQTESQTIKSAQVAPAPLTL